MMRQAIPIPLKTILTVGVIVIVLVAIGVILASKSIVKSIELVLVFSMVACRVEIDRGFLCAPR